jgi:hypothetical protein
MHAFDVSCNTHQIGPYIVSMVDANFENPGQFGTKNSKTKFYFKQTLSLQNHIDVLPNHFEMRSECFDILTFL